MLGDDPSRIFDVGPFVVLSSMAGILVFPVAFTISFWLGDAAVNSYGPFVMAATIFTLLDIVAIVGLFAALAERGAGYGPGVGVALMVWVVMSQANMNAVETAAFGAFFAIAGVNFYVHIADHGAM